jgi:hypothetical protein
VSTPIVRLQNGGIDYVSADSADAEISRLTNNKTHKVRMYWSPRNVLVDVLRSFNGERVLSFFLVVGEG